MVSIASHPVAWYAEVVEQRGHDKHSQQWDEQQSDGNVNCNFMSMPGRN